ncbi:MAG: VacJ family lipoprotein [Candidatus Tectomicrobia bacterium]|nr:VacJ family lipoprotein [Candidatus Tectomicrobia bacterium]
MDTTGTRQRRRKPSRQARLWLAAALLASLAAVASCAAQQQALAPGSPPQAEEEVPDPLEEINRAVFQLNELLDLVILRPLSEVYQTILPDPVRDSVRNFLRNLGSPVVFVNDVLQGRGERAQITFGRFIVNTTLGVGGLFDVAAGMDAPYHSEDFGQTLGVWGLKPGIYLVVPILGPSTTRDAAGRLGDVLLNPLTYLYAAGDVEYLPFVFNAAGAVDLRARNTELIDQLKRDALDYYILIRSIYLQIRESEIRNGQLDSDSPALRLQIQ